MAAHFSKKDLHEIVRLKDAEGLTHKQIAEKLGRLTKDGEPAARAIMKQYKKAKEQGISAVPLPAAPAPSPKKEVADARDLNEMGRLERVRHLREIIPESPRGKFIYDEVLDPKEREMFEEEYFRIIQEEDSFTAAEEGVLFMAILHWTLAMRAMKRDKDTYNRSPQAGYQGANATVYTDQWTREMHENMKKYESMMKSLRLSREQRLKDMQRLGTSFLDFAERVSKTGEQAQIAEEIMALENASEEELKKLQEHGWCISGKLGNNNPCEYEPRQEKKKED